MNAVNALFRDEQEAKLDASIAAADKWLDLARPIILAMFKLEDMESDIVRGSSFSERDHGYRTLREAAGYVAKAGAKLTEMLESIRDDFICDQSRPYLTTATEAETEENDAFNDGLRDQTLSVAAALRIVEAEWNASFSTGATA